MRKSKHQGERHVLDPDEFQIARMIINVCVAQPARGGVTLVTDNGGRHINTFPTGELSPKTQINVFVVQKKIIVQEPDLIDALAAVKTPGCTSGKNRLTRAITIPVGSVATIETYARCCHPIPCAIDTIRSFNDEF